MGQAARKRRDRIPERVVDIGDRRLSLTSTPAPPPAPHHPTTPARARGLSVEEEELVYSLRALYDFRGAEAFVSRFGVETIVEAIRDVKGEADVRNPAAFLRWVVQQGVEDGKV